MKLIKFFHQLFNPNCACNVCQTPRCLVCEELRVLLREEKIEKWNLITTLKNFSQMGDANIDSEETQQTPEPIGPRIVPWETTRRKLESDDRAKAEKSRTQSMEDKATSKRIDELEKELGIAVDVGGENAS